MTTKAKTIIRILGRDWEIKTGDSTDLDSTMVEVEDNVVTRFAGRAFFQLKELWIDTNNTIGSQQEVLLHELLHIVAADMSIDLEETEVKRLAGGLYAALVDNGIWKAKSF